MAEVTDYSPILKSPLVVCLWITGRCNLNCRYCYARPFTNRSMDKDRMLQLADELIDMEVFDITIAGGEPFLHPDIFELIDRLVSGKTNVGVLSNGACINDSMLSRLTDTVGDRKNFLLQISLDGLTPEINDKSRGQGKKVIANLNRICENTNLKLQLASVINAYNIDHISEMIMAYYPRIKRFHFMNLQRTATSLHYPDLFISEERSEKFWEDLETYMKELPKDILVTGLHLMRLTSRMEQEPGKYRHNSTFRCASCTSGVTHVEISSDFDVIGCDIAKDFTVMGNLRDSSLGEVWRSKKADQVRAFTFPPCYLVKEPDGSCLADQYNINYTESGAA